MHILFFSHYFPPEGNAPASRTYEHCVRWVRAGHKVTVVTGVPNVPRGVVYEGYKNRLWPQRENVDGIEVIRVWTLVAANAGFVLRVLNFLSYMMSATLAGLFVKHPDIVIATSPQFFCGWAGVLVQAIKRKPFVLEIRDIWPESIAAVGAMKQGPVIRILQWLERRMYAAADHIVAVGHGYRKNIEGKLRAADIGKVSVIYNGTDGEKFQPAPKDASLLQQFDLGDHFVCAYVGTIGMAHGLETVLDAAQICRDRGREDIRFLLVGDGARRESLQQQAEDRGIADLVRFTGLLPKDEMPRVLSSCDCLLVHLRPCDLFETVIPSKIFEAMAVKRPIIMGVRGESADIVEESGGGISMTPGDAESLVQAVTRLKDNPHFYQQLQASGREFVLDRFSRDRFASEYLTLLQQMVGVVEAPGDDEGSVVAEESLDRVEV